YLQELRDFRWHPAPPLPPGWERLAARQLSLCRELQLLPVFSASLGDRHEKTDPPDCFNCVAAAGCLCRTAAGRFDHFWHGLRSVCPRRARGPEGSRRCRIGEREPEPRQRRCEAQTWQYRYHGTVVFRGG